MRIIFMGTPEFAVGALAALVRENMEVVAVVTAPDRPAGRGLKIKASALKEFAVAHAIPVLQPTNLKQEAFLQELKSYQADLQVVVAFRMLPEAVWDMPPMGTINLHASYLPQYRGAAPINRVIMNGETETGVTTFKLQHEIDTGGIIDRRKVKIGPDETAGELHDHLMEVGSQLLVESIEKMASGEISFIRQEELISEPLKKALKIFNEDCEISWADSIDTIYNLIRGLNPYPGARTTLNGQLFKLFTVEKKQDVHQRFSGAVQTDFKTYMNIPVNGGLLLLKEIQLAGKKRMTVEDFLRGFRVDGIKIG